MSPASRYRGPDTVSRERKAGKVLKGKVALVAGATRGAGRGIAVELGAAGATVYVTGRTTRTRPSELNRPETIEETAELVQQAGGQAIAVPVDHLEPAQVQALVTRIEREQGRLDILVNDAWGADFLIEWNVPVWKHSPDGGLRMLRLAIDTHLITSHFALPLLIKNPGGLVVEMTDGTADYNNANYRLSLFYDLAKTSVIRMAWAQAHELRPHGCTAVALTPGVRAVTVGRAPVSNVQVAVASGLPAVSRIDVAPPVRDRKSDGDGG